MMIMEWTYILKKLVKKMFPNKKLIRLPASHEIFHSYYDFPKGLPKIHEHDKKPSEAYGLYLNKRLVIVYFFSSDIVDGWEKEEVHKDPEKVRSKAFKFGINLIWYILTH